MRTLFALTMSALCLLGCSTPQERALKQQAEMERMMVEFGPACTRLGFAPNADPWRNCVIQLSVREEIDRYGSSASMAGVWGGRGHWGGGGWWGH